MYDNMKIVFLLAHFSIFIHFSTCRDFYLGMFKKNDLLMSQDTLYKEKVPFRVVYAKYGRKYNCSITYVRVLDRLNIGRGPRVEIIRGGLQKKFIVLRLTSPYNNPISVNIFVGCANKKYTNPPWKIIRPTIKTTTADDSNETPKGSEPKEETTEKPPEKTTEKPTDKAAEKPIDETTEKPSDKPAGETTLKIEETETEAAEAKPEEAETTIAAS